MKAREARAPLTHEDPHDFKGRDKEQKCKFCKQTIRPFYGIKNNDTDFYCSYDHYFAYVEALRGGR